MDVKNVWSEFRSQVAVGLIVTLALAFFGAMWTFLKVHAVFVASALGTWAAFGAAVIIALAIVGFVNQIQQLDRAAQKQRLSRRTTADIEKQIREWLWRYKFSVKRDPTPLAEFRMTIDDDRKIPLTVAKLADAAWVTVSSRLLFEEERRAAMPKGGNSFSQDLSIEMNRLGMEYEMVMDKGEVVGIVVGRNLPFDEKTEALDLLNTVRLVRGGMQIAAAMFAKLADAQQ